MSGWRSLHLYLHASEHMDRLLVDVVRPAIERRAGRLGSWFFVRYWEGGPHVRLRVRDLDADDAAALHAELAAGLAALPAGTLDPLTHYAAYSRDPDPVARFGWHADRTVAAIPYLPETERYGGPAGLAVCEDVFRTSSELAMTVLRRVPERSPRVTLATDLLFAMLAGVGLPPLPAALWLRRTVNLWPHVTAVSGAALVGACDAAEATYLERPERWHERHAAVLAACGPDRPPSLPAAWAAHMRAAWARLAGLPRSEILRSLVHMLHNRLGLGIVDEIRVEWLAALVLARARPMGLLGDEGVDAGDRRYHEESKLSAFVPATPFGGASHVDPAPWSPPVGRRLAEAVPLAGISDAVTARASHYDGYAGRLREAELSTLLQLAARHPAAGAIAAVTLLVLVRRVDGLAPGLYRYDPRAHALAPALAPPTDLATLAACSPFLDGSGPRAVEAADAPAWIFVAGDLAAKRPKYGRRAYRFVALEAGHATQNLLLAATALGLRSITLGGFYDDRLAQWLGLDGVQQFPLYMVPIGRPPTATETLESNHE